MTPRRIVVVGHGVAGLTAAQAARDQDGVASITLVGDEPYDAYYRPRLTHDLATGIDAAKLRLRPSSWYEKARIEVLRSATALSLDTAGQSVSLAGGRTLAYDACVLAMGGSSFMPPLAGDMSQGVYTLRSLNDAQEIHARALGAATGTAAIAGGGLLGLETAYALSRLGMRVVVLERGASLLRRQLDRDGGDVLAAVLARAGIEVWTGAEVDRTLSASTAAGGSGGNQPELQGVVLRDERRLDCVLLVVAAGVRPSIALAKAAGIDTNRGGVAVNDRLETSRPGVYACGDVASHAAGNYSIWPQAMAQGKVAGANAAGGAAVYAGVVPQNLLTVAGTSVLAVGEAGAADDGSTRSPAGGAAKEGPAPEPQPRLEVFRLDKEDGRYAKLIFRGESLTGAMLIGKPDLAQAAARAVQSGLTVAGLAQVPEADRFGLAVQRITG